MWMEGRNGDRLLGQQISVLFLVWLLSYTPDTPNAFVRSYECPRLIIMYNSKSYAPYFVIEQW